MTARQVVKRFGHLTLVVELRTDMDNDIAEVYVDSKGLHFGMRINGDIIILDNAKALELQTVYGN